VISPASRKFPQAGPDFATCRGVHRRIPRALKVLLIVTVVVGVPLLIAQDQETLRVRSEKAADDPQSVSYIARLVGAAVTSGSSFRVLTNGDQIFPAMLDAIAQARERIVFETYIFESGSVAEQFVSAFEAAAKRGVKVDMVIDSVGSSVDDALLKRLRDAGCNVVPYNTASWWQLEEINYRTHRKILVIDGEVAFTGGVGLADHWLGNAQDKEHWRDTQVMMRGPIARIAEGGFYENFVEASEQPVTPALHDDSDLAGEGNALVVRSSPTGGSSDLKRLYLLLIASARRTIDIESPYFVSDESTAWALEDALGRGVKIRVLTEGDMTDAKPVKYASRADYQLFLDKGIEIAEYQPSMMHAKAMIVDGEWTMFGSANFDNRSLELNDELNVAVKDRDLAARFTEQFEADLRVSRRLNPAEWARRSFLEKSREKFWSAFGEVF
jgi:cardiolipin synthase A/B